MTLYLSLYETNSHKHPLTKIQIIITFFVYIFHYNHNCRHYISPQSKYVSYVQNKLLIDISFFWRLHIDPDGEEEIMLYNHDNNVKIM